MNMINLNPTIVAVIPAAGVGKRMGSEIPKQYIKVAGKTILEHTVHALKQHPAITQIVIALAKADAWIEQTNLHNMEGVHYVVGGADRSESVLSGLSYAKTTLNADWALVHDAARPLIKPEYIQALCCSMRLVNVIEDPAVTSNPFIGSILAIPVKDTIKQAYQAGGDNVIDKTIPRDHLWAAQTPQLFPVETLIEAIEYCHQHSIAITDEASAMEAIGLKTKLVQGESSNIKLTEPGDLMFIEAMLK